MNIAKVRNVIASVVTLSAVVVFDNHANSREYLQLPKELAGRSYSPGVITRGGKTIWLAGVTTLQDEQGKSLAGDIEGQTRFAFREIARQLAKAGSKLEDIVTMTVYLTDARNGAQFATVRKEVFPSNPPASAQITVSALAVPGFLIEIQCIAVVGDDK
jgi:2-iminobutanoate/2-iminopropanoate deaminase